MEKVQLSKILTKEFFDKNKKRYEELREQVLKEIDPNETNTVSNFSFILGAGVSMSMNLPSWGNLLSCAIGNVLYYLDDEFDIAYSDNDVEENKIIKSLLRLKEIAYRVDFESKGKIEKFKKGRKGEYFDAIKNANLLEVAEYIYNFLYDKIALDVGEFRKSWTDEYLVSLVHMTMLNIVKEKLGGLDKCIENKIYEKTTMESIVEVIKEIFSNKKKTYKIITYNYENLLEYCLEKKAGIDSSFIESISHTDKNRLCKDNKINVFHIHGKFNLDDTDKADAISENIILSENSYYEIEKCEYM